MSQEASFKRFQLGYQFETLCQQIFISHDFDVKPEVMIEGINNGRLRADIIFNKDDLDGIAEVKLYNSRTVSPRMIENAVKRLTGLSKQYKVLLIVSAVITQPYKQQLLDQFHVRIWDIVDLFHLTFDQPELYYQLEQLYVQATGETPGDLMLVNSDGKTAPLAWLSKKPATTSVPLAVEKTKGEELCEILKGIAAGRESEDENSEDDGAKSEISDRLYEKACIDILKYLFERDLALWDDQHTTDSGIHRFDLICRIRSDHNFWRELANDFKTRYVLFEFKNYSKKIKQGQVYTTEKYLFSKGYRNVAFIISKKGADKNAGIAAKGALREQGKLIINLTDEDLCTMLKLYESREERHKISDPSHVLREKIDEMLTKVIR